MRYLTWWVLLGVLALYTIIVSLFPFAGPVALGIHFTRISVTVAGLIIYMRMMQGLFREVPTPRRDYLQASINFFFLSLVCFSFWNEAGRVFGTDPSIFTSLVAGLFSMFAIVAAVLALLAPDTEGNRPKFIALAIGVACGGLMAFVAPFFRQ